MNSLEKLNQIMDKVISNLQHGLPVLVSDSKTRENEGDLIASAETITYDSLNFFATKGRGLICAPISIDYAKRLDLNQMVKNSTDSYGTAFTISVDAKEETTTGISISDRLATLRKLSHPNSLKNNFKSPGHIFPLIAVEGGLFKRGGHTEASLELMTLAHLKPAAVICEVLNEDGTMACGDQLLEFSEKFDIPHITTKEIIYYLKMQPNFVFPIARTKLPTDYGNFEMVGYNNREDDKEHFALIMGDPSKFSEDTPIRIHSECLTGDLLTSHRCDCGSQLNKAMKLIQEKGEGLIIYLRQEGRGIGLFNKIKAYQLQDSGVDTVDANLHLGFKSDLRNYAVAAAILKNLGIKKIQLLTNNPKKIEGLKYYGIDVSKRVQIEIHCNESNRFYLQTKKKRMGHLLDIT